MRTVSILIPTHKGRENYVKEILDTLNIQTYKDFEVIICDNDYKKKVAPNFIKNYDFQIKYIINSQNIGPQKNIEKLIQLSKNKYFKFILSDDLITYDFLEKSINILEKDQEIQAVFTKRIFINEKGNYTHDANFYNLYNIPFKKLLISELFKTSVKYIDWFPGELTNFIFRKRNYHYNLFQTKTKCNNCFAGSYDLILYLNLFKKKDYVFYLNEPLCKIRNHSERSLLEHSNSIICRLDYYYFMYECYKRKYISKQLFENKTFQLLNEIYTFLENINLNFNILSYINKLLHSIFSCFEHKKNKIYLDCLKVILFKNIAKKMFKLSDKKIIIYGAGEYTKNFFLHNKSLLKKVEYFIDDYKNGTFLGKKVLPLKQLDKNAIYFISSYTNKTSMINKLKNLGIKEIIFL